MSLGNPAGLLVETSRVVDKELSCSSLFFRFPVFREFPNQREFINSLTGALSATCLWLTGCTLASVKV